MNLNMNAIRHELIQHTAHTSVSSEWFSELPELVRWIRYRMPASLLTRHSRLPEVALCGFLFRSGIEDGELIKEVSGLTTTEAVVSIWRVLDDCEASSWYFETLDAMEQKTFRASSGY